jgi:hypothetical protein
LPSFHPSAFRLHPSEAVGLPPLVSAGVAPVAAEVATVAAAVAAVLAKLVRVVPELASV